ncbi:MAG: LuxR C-terminal-related transcriptional regulator [Burkholderiales bacterium]|nr:LuxR C-terminal-related transcriptional regulator [Burkholderiales bacterium]
MLKEEYKNYLNEKIIPDFKNFLDKDIFSVIINCEHEIEICTNKSANSVGVSTWEDLCGISFADYEDESILRKYFKEAYSPEFKNDIKQYLKKLLYLQKLVIDKCIVIQFIDMLPYDNKLITYVTTYTPVLHPDGSVIAIQSFANQSYVLRFQGHLSPPVQYISSESDQYTDREREVLFLLSNGATQEKISEILNVSRSTIASIISNQLCPKFNIAGANTKLLTDAAIKAGLYKNIPKSLWKPCIIILNHDLHGVFINEI